ncbi:MAG: glycosyltransferase family 4 protein, partial [bacterium]
LGFPPDRMRVILNGADPAEFHPGKEDRAALGLPENVPLALFAGDIRTGRKNLDTTLAALAKSPNLHLAVVGKKEGSPFPALAEKLGVAERTHFLDFRRDIAQIMRACDFFVFPSRYEACALVLVEAISSGLPVITAKTTGGSEVISEASGILLNDPNDAEALATAMNRLVGDRDLRQAMSMAAAESSSRYTWDKIAGAYYGLYRETASGKES